MGTTSKDLLDLEQKKPSSLESPLLVCRKDLLPQKQKPQTGEKLVTSVTTSQVIGKVKDFLGVMAEANKKLELNSQDNPSENYNIEALNGNETEYIELDLMLGIADLHTPEAVAAAESAMAGSQPAFPLSGLDSESDSEESSDEGSDDDDDDDEDARFSKKDKKLDLNENISSSNRKSKKRPKITELH